MRRHLFSLFLSAGILAVMLAPLVMLLLLPFQGEGGAILPGLDGRRFLLLGRSLLVAGAAAGGATLIGLPLALAVAWRPGWLLACLLPFFFPPYLQAMLWPRFFDLAGLPHNAIPPLATGIAIFTLSYAPIVMLLAASGLRQFPREEREAGLLARPPAAVFLRILMPGLLPNLAAGFLLAFVFTLTNFEVPDLLGFKVYPVEIFIAVSAYYDETGAALLALPLVAVTLSLILLQARLMAGRAYLLFPAQPAPVHAKRPVVWPVVLYLLLAIGPPLFAILASGQTGAQWRQAWAVGLAPLVFSLATALAGGLLTTLAALPLAYYAQRHRQNVLGRFVDAACQVPLALPPLLIGLGTTRLANHAPFVWLYDSTACYLLAVAVAHLPFAVKILASRLTSIPQAAVEAARLARSETATFWRIILPPLRPALAIATLTVFALALANLSLPLLTLPPGRETLPLKLYNYLHYGAQEMVSSMGLMLVLAGASAAIVLALPFRRKGRSRWPAARRHD